MYFFRIFSVLLITVLNLSNSADEPSLPVWPPFKVADKTYYIETFFKANWFRAAQFCRFNGMQLASVNNEEENNKLVEALSNFKTGDNATHYDFWTSGNNFAVIGTFSWLSTGADFQFQNWYRNQPDNANGTEHCVEYFGYPYLAWNDRRCDREQYFICEVQN